MFIIQVICNRCDGRCGPGNGCPCEDCFELIRATTNVRTNRVGDVVYNGTSGSGGFTGLTPNRILYCGKQKNQCKCNRCDGRCGPGNGCPCEDCFELVRGVVSSP